MYKNSIVITDMELFTPFAETYTALQEIENNTIKHVESLKFEGSEKPVYKINTKILSEQFSPRIRKKRDNFVLMAQLVAERLMEKSQLTITDENSEDIGIILGNCTGGWSYVEPQLIEMYRDGFQKLNSYVATAWFPTAPQGEISIKHNLKGYSKTISSDRLSGGLAIKHAIQNIENGNGTSFLAGGVEAPLTPLVYNALNKENDILSEGAVLAIIEPFEEAQKRDRKPLAKILSIQCASTFEIVIDRIVNQEKETCDLIYNHKLTAQEANDVQKALDKHQLLFQGIKIFEKEINHGNLLAAEATLAIAYILSECKGQTGKKVMINTSDQNGLAFSILIEML